MNKKRNKSYRSLKNMRRHVEKTKRRHYSNKNKKRTLTNIHNNKTKVVEKRRRLRRIVQRGGGGELKFLINLIMSDNPNSKKIQGVDAFLRQMKTEYGTQVVGHMLEVAAAPADGVNERTALYAACTLFIPNIELVKLLLNNNFNPNVSNGQGSFKLYPLHGVVQTVFRIINDQDANEDIKKERLYEIVEILKMLINSGSDKNNTDISELTAFDAYNTVGLFNPKSPQSLSQIISAVFPKDPIISSINDLLKPNTKALPHGAPSQPFSEYYNGAVASYDLGTQLDWSQIPVNDSWFSKVFGFNEMIQTSSGKLVSIVPRVMLLETKKTPDGDRKILKSLISGKVFDAGIPIIETTGTLMLTAQHISSHPWQFQFNPPTLNIIKGDVVEFFKQRELQGSLFQVASQFNVLEMANPKSTPEMGITIYQHDRTQGPVCAMACPSGTLYRNYFAMPLHNGDIDGTAQSEYRNCQLNMLDGVMSDLIKETPPIHMVEQNGYILPMTLSDITNLKNLLAASEVKMMELVKRVKYFVQEDVPVLSSEDDGKEVNRVSQIFCSGFPFVTKYSEPITKIDQKPLINSSIARMILYAAYNATFAHAVKMAKTQNKIIKVFLTYIGGGEFGTATTDVIIDIVRDILQKTCSNYPIEVYMVDYTRGQRFESGSAATPTVASANTSPLPSGWVEFIDSASGRPYYKTPAGVVTWDRPSTLPVAVHQAPVAVQAMVPPLPHNWVQRNDPASNKPYYENLTTGITYWEHPSTLPVTVHQGQAAVHQATVAHHQAQVPPLPVGWVKQMDIASGRPYYLNNANGRTQWEHPSTSSGAHKRVEIPLPPDWILRQTKQDGNFKDIFYYNTKTYKISHDIPKGRWMWENDDASKYIPFDSSVNDLLEQAFSDGLLKYEHSSPPWSFDFNNLMRMTQTNRDTGSQRLIIRT